MRRTQVGSTQRRRWAHVGVVGLCLVASACSTSPDVAIERSDRSSGELSVDTAPPLPDVGAERSSPPAVDDSDPAADDAPVDAPESSLSWGDCGRFGIPSADVVGTSGWECATLDVPMDPFAPGREPAADTPMVELALTRHPATGTRRGAILVNPGGPGGPGLETTWALRNELSTRLLDGFDIVSWDPRGIGQSSPRIDCDDDVPPGDEDFIAGCVELTGPVSAFLAAPYSVADMEAIRVALGEDRLDYLGYSYGTLLGATYARVHPDRVGAFVLDGATDPGVGSADGPFDNGFPSLADDGFDDARRRFVELCNATDRCLFSLDAEAVLDDLADQVAVLPTADFDGAPERVGADRYREIIDNALTFAGDWELLATALEDADRGDASALASLASGPTDPLGGDPDGDDPAPDEPAPDDRPGESDFAEANYMIYCADFAGALREQAFCDAMPDNEERLAPVAPVDVDREILVIGTEFDPLTPGYHAPDFAEVLGDATYIIWEGVGHTAYPGWTPCIDDAVDAQFFGDPLPTGGTRCTFLFGVDDDATLGAELFGHGDVESEFLLEARLALELGDTRAACLAPQLNSESDQVISHVILDVRSDVAGDALESADSQC